MQMKKQIGVIGGGAAGMMAAITAAKEGAQVTILERNDRVGKKILQTGNGKCNLGNRALSVECYHGGDLEWIRDVLEHFDTEDTIRFFQSIGLMVKEKNSYLYVGLRYAFSSFKYDVSTLPVDDPIWGGSIGNPSLEDDYWGGSVPFSHLGMKGSMQWFELVVGVKVRIYKNFNMGWSVRMKYKTSASTNEYANPWYVPGYGKFKSNNMGITYSLIYKLPL